MKRNLLIAITGGPGTGKSKLIETLQDHGYTCFEEISRHVIDKGKQLGMHNYFLESPQAFSKELFEGRKQQYSQANSLAYRPNKPFIFLDRGLPDVIAYLEMQGIEKPDWNKELSDCRYDRIIFLPPWEAIYKQDSQRMEPYERAVKISKQLWKTYSRYYSDLQVLDPGTLQERVTALINSLTK
ncbi:MAG: AAA family ATPase [Flavobacteriaceae bacterium]